MKRIRIIPDSQLRATNALLMNVLPAWRSQWCMSGQDVVTPVAVRVGKTTNTDALRSYSWLGKSSAQGSVHIGVESAAAWMQVVFGDLAMEVPRDEVSSMLMEKARRALVADVMTACGVEADGDDSLPDDAFHYCGGFIVAVLTINSIAITFLLDGGLLQKHLPAPAPVAAMTDRGAAISDAVVTLRATLPLARISVESLQRLHVGDVLMGDAALATRFLLRTEKDVVVAKGHLMRQDRNRVLLLESN